MATHEGELPDPPDKSAAGLEDIELEVAAGRDAPAPAPAPAPDPHSTNLQLFYARAETFKPLPAPDFFVKVKKQPLEKAVHGQVLLCRCTCPDVGYPNPVVVKQLVKRSVQRNMQCEANDKRNFFRPNSLRPVPHIEDSLTEIGVYDLLRREEDISPWILKMLDCYFDNTCVYIVLEYASGGEALTKVMNQGRFPEAQLKITTGQLFEAVAYLHRKRIGHRDISLENVLLKDSGIKLMDFGQAAATHTSCGRSYLRYFGQTAKETYRAPEAFLFSFNEFFDVNVPKGAVPGAIVYVKHRGRFCHVRLRPPKALTLKYNTGKLTIDYECRRPEATVPAQLWGYTLPPIDAFACGVCLFIMAVGAPPWSLALEADRSYKFILRSGLDELLRQWNKPLPDEVSALIKDLLLAVDPEKRPSMQECLDRPWLQARRV